MDLVLLRLLLELGFCFMTVASMPPVNDQSSAATSKVRVVRQPDEDQVPPLRAGSAWLAVSLTSLALP